MTASRGTFLTQASLLLFSFLLAVDLYAQTIPHPAASSDAARAVAAYQEGRLDEAETTLRSVLAAHPRDLQALSLMGVVLDAEKRFGDAESYYRRALDADPNSAALWNNLGNHYVAGGKAGPARQAFLKVVAFDPRHVNANLQLARLSIETRDGKQALRFLDRLPAEAMKDPSVGLLRAQAQELSGDRSSADRTLQQVIDRSPGDARVQFSAGLALADWKQYERAEALFSEALRADPANPEVLYNLGLAASNSGHLDRAHQVFDIALKRQPDDPDLLFNLARVDSLQGNDADAIVLLVKAHRLAPKRPEIALLMANVSEGLGYYGDAASAFSDYLKIVPGDDTARRERAFALARTMQLDAALHDLRWYVQKHPGEAVGYYELGVAEVVHQRDLALKHLDQAIKLDPKLVGARYARAVLNFQAGRWTNCLPDLESILKEQPQNEGALDVLGEVDLQLNRPADAVKALGTAAELAPDSRKVLIHYSRALQKNHQEAESLAVLRKFQQLPPEGGKPTGGLVDYLSLPREQQRARYLANLKRDVTLNPQDVSLKVRWALAELTQNDVAGALQTFDEILASNPEPEVLASCARSLMDAQQYAEGQKFLETLLQQKPANGEARLDLALAIFHEGNLQQALAILEGTPQAEQQGDYYLLRAQLLDAAGKTQAAVEALNVAMRLAPTREDLYFETALFLLKHDQVREAEDLLRQAVQIIPNSPQLLLTQAIVLGLAKEFEESQRLLGQIESRWPEWSEVYLIHGITLVGQAKSADAKPFLQTAIDLGARDPMAYYNLALADTEGSDIAGAEKAIGKALELDPEDAYTQSLAGRIAYIQRDYRGAVEHLTEAVRLWPDMVEAHQTLSASYRALGDKDRSIAELQEIVRIKQATRAADQAPPSSIQRLLFSVPKPTSGLQ